MSINTTGSTCHDGGLKTSRKKEETWGSELQGNHQQWELRSFSGRQLFVLEADLWATPPSSFSSGEVEDGCGRRCNLRQTASLFEPFHSDRRHLESWNKISILSTGKSDSAGTGFCSLNSWPLNTWALGPCYGQKYNCHCVVGRHPQSLEDVMMP